MGRILQFVARKQVPTIKETILSKEQEPSEVVEPSKGFVNPQPKIEIKQIARNMKKLFSKAELEQIRKDLEGDQE